MVVFSIDGSFTASVSVTGKDPKVTMVKTIMTSIKTMTGPPELGGRGAALARPGLPHHLRHRQTVYAAAEGTDSPLSALSTAPSQEITRRQSRARLGDT